MDSYFYLVILAGLIAGASTALLGVYIVGMRLPFIGTCISHAAMAGAVLSVCLGWESFWTPVVFSMVVAAMLALIDPERTRLDPNVALAILFNLMLGLTFLAIGLTQRSRAELLGLLWGSLLFVDSRSVLTITGFAAVLALFAAVFAKELKAIVFSRSIASATGIHATAVYACLLALCGMVLAVNLPLIGGLLIFSLMTAPAAAAYQLCRGHRSVVLVAMVFGMLSAVVGFLLSYLLDWPTGACIVLVSTALFAFSAVCNLLRAGD